MLADPAFDDEGDRLHGGMHIDLAAGIARSVESVRQFEPEALIGKADRASAMDRKLEHAGETRHQRADLAAAPEEDTVAAVIDMLVAEDPQAPAASQRP